MICREDVGYCNASAVTSVGKAETHDVVVRVDDDSNCKTPVACLSSVVTTITDSDTCLEETVIVAIAAVNVATIVVVANVVVATTDVDLGKPRDGADLDAVPAEESLIATSPNGL